MSTDSAWEEWGRRDPYFGVLTQPQFRQRNITESTKLEFFDSGRRHVDFVLQTIRQYIDASFAPQTVLDYGCGVGRTIIAFAPLAKEVFGVDISPSMLAEAQQNCVDRNLSNVKLSLTDDLLSTVSGRFDLIHSFIVFQHIAPERGRQIFSKLLAFLSPGGVAAIHFTYSKRIYVATHGMAPILPKTRGKPPPPMEPSGDPEMQMNPYLVNELLFLIQTMGVQRFHTEFTDHGGELGLLLFFAAPT
jgi:SAM-dependent methyltransferase